MEERSPPRDPGEKEEEGNKSKRSEPCLVCGVSTTGVHFQVNCCRACAAFFRRSVRSKSSYRCQKSVGKCDVTLRTIGKPICRFCRLKKCIQIGMRIQKDAIKEEPSTQNVEELTQNINSESSSSTIVAKVFETVSAIFRQKGIIIAAEANINLTKSFSEEVAKLLECSKPKEPLICLTDFGKRDKTYMETFLINTAKTLMQFEYFAALDISEKFLLFKRFRQIFHVLERCYQTSCHYGDEDLDDTRVCLGSSHYVELSKAQETFISKNKQKELNSFILPFLEKITLLLRPFKKACLTNFEFGYICLVTLWSCYDILELSSATHKLGEDLISRVSEDLHEYYVREMRMVNYAARQRELFKLIQIAEYIRRRYLKKFCAAQNYSLF